MRQRDGMRPTAGRRTRVRAAAAALVALGAVAACTGENLFTGPALGGSLLGPMVAITAPGEGATIAPGDSVQVTVSVASDNGVTQLTFSGAFGTGVAAFVSEVVTLPSSPQDTTFSNFLRQAGTTTGGAKIIVEAQDVLGATGADTVSVEIATP